MASGESEKPGARIASLAFWRDLLIVVAIVIIGLFHGSDLLIPLAVALLLFVLLTALIDWIETRTGLPKWAAHLVGIASIFFGIATVLLILGRQAEAVVAEFPIYAARFEGLAERAAQLAGPENAATVREAFENLDLSDFARDAAGGAGSFLSAFFLVLLYIPFLMVERGPMSRKMPLAAGDPGLARHVAGTLSEASTALQHYVGIKTFVSLLTGLLSYAVMKPMGLDFAETWALLAFALNFIPSIGSILGVVFPALVALVQFDTLGPFLIIAIGCGLVQFAIGNILEPALTGEALNLSPLMVILALAVWTVIWGIPGAFLSVPLTVSMLIIFSHIPATRPVAILMSGDGNLPQADFGKAVGGEN